MFEFIRRIGLPRRQPRSRSVTPAARLSVEQLESRDVPAPLAPTGVVASGISASAISLTWNASTDPTVTGYDVYAKVWYSPPHGGKGSPSGGHYVYNLLANNQHANTDTFSGLLTGHYYTYVVTAVNATGQSPYSLPGTGETWIAPSFSNGPNIFLLSSGALWSGQVNATVGLTTEVFPLVSGNPLTFSVVSGPTTASIDVHTGALLYTPAQSDVGTVNVTLKASNTLGAVTQTIQFNVAAYPKLKRPTLLPATLTSTYNGMYQQISATAFGTNGVMAVAGTYAIAYGPKGYPINAGTYHILVTFNSLDSSYGNATRVISFTVNKATPAFNYLSAPTIAVGAATTTVSGHIAAGTAIPGGEYVVMTLHGVSQATTVDANGNFTSSFVTGALAVGNYTITYAFAGDSNFKAAANGSSTLTVVPLAVPVVTQNPSDHTTTAGDGVSFTAAATGSPVITVQWQVSTDGGATFTNITGNASATTTTLSFFASAGQTGDKYRAVFTNSAGKATTSIATLKVEGDTGGGGD